MSECLMSDVPLRNYLRRVQTDRFQVPKAVTGQCVLSSGSRF